MEDTKKTTRIIKTVLCASVKGREEQLKVVLKSIYDQVDEIHLVLNFYLEVPDWINNLTKIYTYLNPENKNAHDAIWFRTLGLESVDKTINHVNKTLDDGERQELQSRYYFSIDDDLLYPANYVAEMVEAIERHERNAVITAHGSNIVRPVRDYFECRHVYGFSDRQERDIFVDMAGVGCSAWHSSTIKPTPNDFPIPFCRDLWLSILTHKGGIENYAPLISLQRPTQWIMPLVTEGETVYEATQTNVKLKALKNRILKEQLLPLIYLNQNCKDYVLMTDYNFDERLVANSLETLDNVTYCNAVMFSNNLKQYKARKYKSRRDERSTPPVPIIQPLTEFVTDEEFNIGRMGSKVLTQYRFMQSLPDGSRIISADCDLHYMADPFTAFDISVHRDGKWNTPWDIAVTTRPYEYHYPINAGVVFFKMNKRVRDLLDYLIAEVYDRTWFELMQYQRKFGHTGNDWDIDQDILCVCYIFDKLIKERFGVKIIDVGPKYNFCPHCDGSDEIVKAGKQQLMEAYNNKSAVVLHLKSRLKELLFDGLLK